MALYKVVRPDGSVVYTDAPQGPGEVQALGADGQPRPQQPYDHKQVVSAIKEVQKRVPKINDYLDYLEYLRTRSPLRFDRVMRELQREDPAMWMKLQKYPQFRPLRESAIGLKAAEKNMGAAISILTGGSPTGTAEKWLETTVKDMMKRDRWGPYADVLGAKGSTLPAPKPPSYSNSRLGQFLKTEDARLASAAKDAAKELEMSRAAVRASKATAVTRVLGPVLDLGLQALDPENGHSAAVIAQRVRIDRLIKAGVLDDEQVLEARTLLSQGKNKELKELLDKWTSDYLRGGR